ncbi:MAG: 6-phosphogluconolactonase [Nitrospinae bacterium]|nr:6-phosphogluconolactonase [Nitrospinota bacterium]
MPLAKPDIRIVGDAEELSQAGAEEFVSRAAEAVRAQGLVTVALSGGSTPQAMFQRLASDALRDRVAWDKVHVFWGDERHVSPDHPESNYRMAHEALLSKVPVPAAHVHRIKTENPDASQAADEYARELRAFFRLGAGHVPRFDLVLLGMGPDGHTASLFPGTEAVHEHTRLVAAPWVEKFNTYRVTLTPPVLNNATSIIFLIGGEDKAEALWAVLEGDHHPDRFPSQVIRPIRGTLVWLVDRRAARLLRPTG